jgi:hypothetical protein
MDNTYNKKGFLLPDSIHSMAAYHAKLFPDGKYIFRIHDCLGGVRLTGELKEDESAYTEAYKKLMALSVASMEFALHIYNLKREKFHTDYSQEDELQGHLNGFVRGKDHIK